jgi:hypothetical protein
MARINRRSILAMGLGAASLLVLRTPSAAAAAGEERELAKGVKERILGEGPAIIPGYSKVSMRDIMYEPGATSPAKPDEECHGLPHHPGRAQSDARRQGLCGQEGPCLDLCQGHHHGRGHEHGHHGGDHADYRLARDLVINRTDFDGCLCTPSPDGRGGKEPSNSLGVKIHKSAGLIDSIQDTLAYKISRVLLGSLKPTSLSRPATEKYRPGTDRKVRTWEDDTGGYVCASARNRRVSTRLSSQQRLPVRFQGQRQHVLDGMAPGSCG